jgi:sulfur carrier protein
LTIGDTIPILSCLSFNPGHPDSDYIIIFISPKFKISHSFMSNQINLQVNGETRNCVSPTALPELLQQLGFNLRLIAVEYNGEILHRQFWTETHIKNGDRLEVVTIVGGG